MIFPASTKRVKLHTPKHINEQIRRRTEANIACFATGGRESIDRRLEELDREWDIERTLEANASAFSLLGLTLGATVNRKWLGLSAVVAGFLLQHALQGWCPPVSVLRRLGFRTRSEIDEERYALKLLRGDFEDNSTEERKRYYGVAGRTLEAVRR